MSWGLFNHNYVFTDDDVEFPTDPDAVVVPTEIYVADTVIAIDANYRSMFASGSNGKILVSPKPMGGLYFDYSGDRGETWTRYPHGLYTGSTSNRNQSMDYDELNDAFYFRYYEAGSKIGRVYRSLNNGESWTEMVTSSDTLLWGLGILTDEDGALCAAGRSSSVAICNNAKYSDPANNTSQTSVESFALNGFTQSMTQVGTKYYVMVDGGATNHIASMNVDFTGTPVVDMNAMSLYELGNRKTKWGEQSPRAILPISRAAGVITFYSFDDSSSTAPYPQTTETFPENVFYGDTAYGNGTWVMFAPADDGNEDRIRTKYSIDGVNWIGTQSITLAKPATDDVRIDQAGYIGDNWWVFAYTDVDYFMTLIKVHISGGNAPPPVPQKLSDVIQSQAPDIFYKMDDEKLSLTVLDVGRIGYGNTVAGTITFLADGIVDDGGTAALIGAAVDTAVCISETIPASTHDAHLFVMQHNGTAAIRTLMHNGDHAEFDQVGGNSFFFEIQADNTLRYGAYNGSEWEYLTTDLLEPNTNSSLILIIENSANADRGKVSIYNYGVRLAYDGDMATPQTTGTNQRQCVGGKYSAGSIIESANGVTIDYYSQIPYENLNLTNLIDALIVDNEQNPTELTVTPIYHETGGHFAGGNSYPNRHAGWVTGYGDKIFIAGDNAFQLKFSDDGGDTWVDRTVTDPWPIDSVGGVGTRISSIAYDKVYDIIYVCVAGYTAGYDGAITYSKDDGVSWTQLDKSGTVYQNSAYIYVTEDGRCVFPANVPSSSGSEFKVFNANPSGNGGAGTLVNQSDTPWSSGNSITMRSSGGVEYWWKTGDPANHDAKVSTIENLSGVGITDPMPQWMWPQAPADSPYALLINGAGGYKYSVGLNPVGESLTYPYVDDGSTTDRTMHHWYGNDTYAHIQASHQVGYRDHMQLRISDTGLPDGLSEAIKLNIAYQYLGTQTEIHMVGMGGGVWLLAWVNTDGLQVGKFTLDAPAVAPDPPDAEPPDVSDPTNPNVGTVFLIHADSSLPVTRSGRPMRELPNAINNGIKCYSENGSIITSDSKFGAGAAGVIYRSSQSGTYLQYTPRIEGSINLGRRRFSYDVWHKPNWSNGFCYVGSNQKMYQGSGKSRIYSGMTISVSAQPSNSSQCRISINIGATLDGALANGQDQLIMHWNNIDGYNINGYNHIAVCRDTGLSFGGYPVQKWYVFCNGNMGGNAGVIEGDLYNQSHLYANIGESDKWYLGGYLYDVHPDVHEGAYPVSLYTPPVQLDEARLVLDQALYTSPFTPPSAPYT